MAKTHEEAIAIQKFCDSLSDAFDDGEIQLHYDNESELVIINNGISISVDMDSVRCARRDILRGLSRWLHDNQI